MSKPTTKQIATIIDSLILGGKLNKENVSSILAAYLVAQKRTRDLDSILRKLVEIRNDRGVYEATTKSAFPLDSDTRLKLEQIIKKEYPSAKEIIIDEQHDKSVVGGVRLDSSEIRFDATVRGKLQHFTQLTSKA